jgi:putative membrane protein
MIRLAAMALGLALMSLPAAAQVTANDGAAHDSGGWRPVITTDAEFLRVATSANLLEIVSSQLALEQAQSEEVRRFAEQMIADHTAATQELARVSGTPAPDLTADPAALLDTHHAERLAALRGTAAESFDAAYVTLQRQAHEEAIYLFQDYATNGQEGPVKEFAEATLPKLQSHFDAAQDLPSE